MRFRAAAVAGLASSLLGLVAAACGSPNEGDATTVADKNQNASKTRPADRTEVTMQRAPVEAAPPDGPGSASAGGSGAASNAPSSAASGDPADDPMIGGAQEPAVDKALAPVRPRIRACYKKALAAEPGIGGTATFDLTLGNQGNVASARFVKRDGLNEDMVGCLLAAVKTMTFDAGRKSQIPALSFGTPPAKGASDAVDGGRGTEGGRAGDAGTKK